MTRAALLVLRMVPMALEAFLDIARRNLGAEDRISTGPLGGLASLGSPIRVATQDSRVHRAASEDHQTERTRVDVLLSVYLTPDDRVEFVHKEIQPSSRVQRLDGVIEFDQSLIIAIESKVVEGMPPDQSEHINLQGVEAVEKPVVHVSWQELFEALVRLSEEGLLGKAERELIDDLYLFAQDSERFEKLLPFTTLKRCEGSEARIKRRLRAILGDATGFEETTTWGHGWNYLIPGGVTCSEIGLFRKGGQLSLTIWPGQRAHQSRALLGRGIELRAIEEVSSSAAPKTDEPAGWLSGVTPLVGYYRFHWDLRPSQDSTLATYADNADRLLPLVGETRHADFDARVKGPLLEMGLASPDDGPTFQRVVDTNAKPTFKAACWITRTWEWDAAVSLDDDGRLVKAVAKAAAELFGALGENGPESLIRRNIEGFREIGQPESVPR